MKAGRINPTPTKVPAPLQPSKFTKDIFGIFLSGAVYKR